MDRITARFEAQEERALVAWAVRMSGVSARRFARVAVLREALKLRDEAVRMRAEEKAALSGQRAGMKTAADGLRDEVEDGDITEVPS